MKLHYALGIGAVGCPCLGVGAWQVYEEVNPTLERALRREGRSKGLISPKLLEAKEVSSKTASEYLSNENYGCFQWFFPGVDLPKNSTSGSGTQTLANPFAGSGSDSSPVTGCALMRMVPTGSNNFFLKSEITFKNDTQGWVIWTHLTNHNISDSQKCFIYFRILFLGRNSASDNWSIKSGVYLEHYGTTVSGSPSISTPNGTTWSNYAQEQHYAGFWESNGSSGKTLMQDIKLEYGHANKLFTSGNIHTTSSTDGLICKGIYDASGNKWTTFANSNNCCISGALTEAFKNFKDKKGTWKTVETYCSAIPDPTIRYKSIDDNIKDRIKGLCYPKNSTTE